MIVSSEFWELFCWLCCNDGSIFLNFDIHVWIFFKIVRVNVNLWNGSPINVIDVNNLVFDVFGWLQLPRHCLRILFTVKIIISTFWLVTFQRRFKVWNKLKCFLLVCDQKDFITKLNQLRVFLCQFRASTRIEYFSLKMPRACFFEGRFSTHKIL